MAENTNVTSTGKGNGARQKDGQSQDRHNKQTLLPSVDVIEDASGITMLADLPGVPRDKLSLQIESDNLTIEGEVQLALPEGMESTHAEVRLPRYRRSFTLSKELDGEQASAEFRNGVLKLRIPKAQHAQPRKIEVRVQ